MPLIQGAFFLLSIHVIFNLTILLKLLKKNKRAVDLEINSPLYKPNVIIDKLLHNLLP